jgi:hypothetical protein
LQRDASQSRGRARRRPCQAEHRINRNKLKGRDGDRVNAILAAAAIG